MTWSRERQREYVREWTRKRRLDPEFRATESERQRRYQKKHPLTYMWNNYQSSARKRGFEWAIDRKFFDKMLLSNCSFCGIAPNPINGIDRLDNTLGYVESNCIPACTICNYAKRQLTKQEFIAWAIRVATFNTGG